MTANDALEAAERWERLLNLRKFSWSGNKAGELSPGPGAGAEVWGQLIGANEQPEGIKEPGE